MANILGLSFHYHDSAAALVQDGKLIAAASEERFTRVKHCGDFPAHAIEFCLERSGLSSVQDLDAIVFYEKPTVKFLRILETLVHAGPQGIAPFVRRIPSYLEKKLDIRKLIRQKIPAYDKDFFFSDHHLSHAALSFYASPFEEAAIITADAVGEMSTTCLGYGRASELKITKSIGFPHSLGIFYAAVTDYLGFQVNDGEWKVMGLAPYGKDSYRGQFEELLQIRPDGSFRLNLDYFRHAHSFEKICHDRRWEKLFGFPRRDQRSPLQPHHLNLAHSAQKILEKAMLHLAAEAKRQFRTDSLVIGGGVALNVAANTAIEKSGIFNHVWVPPAPGDDGAAAGAALAVAHQVFGEKRHRLTHSALGDSWGEEEIHLFAKSKGVSGTLLSAEEFPRVVAKDLADGKVVGWFQGAMEFGPRALGNRSILAAPQLPEMKDRLNQKIKFREFFRPFAPVILKEEASRWFETNDDQDFPFMSKLATAREKTKELAPTAVHVDGTSRLQTVDKEEKPRLHELLRAFYAGTNVPILINTSFNLSGEPIVRTPEDAFKSFSDSGMDALALGPYYIRKADLPESRPSEMGSATEQVRQFYARQAFNERNDSLEAARELQKEDPLRQLTPLVDHLSRHAETGITALDVGCGGGWALNALAFHHHVNGVGIDQNPAILKQARSVARLTPGAGKNEFLAADLLEFNPPAPFDLVISIGVVHHLENPEQGFRQLAKWTAPGGYLLFGFYNRQMRMPLLAHFQKAAEQNLAPEELYEKYLALNPKLSKNIYSYSWFHDQVLHPSETLYSTAEVSEKLSGLGFHLRSTSLNHFGALPTKEEALALERKLSRKMERSLKRNLNLQSGFVYLWAQKNSSKISGIKAGAP